MSIDDLLYEPIIREEEAKTFKELCDDAAAKRRMAEGQAHEKAVREGRLKADARRQKIEGEFRHLRGKLFVRDNPDGSADIVHKELAKMRRNQLGALRRVYRKTKYGLRRSRD